MRLRTLSLERYGRFTDRTIEFGEATPGAPDLHIVYGPNEAGKSTAFAGFLDLLFGIEMQSRYNFLHPYDTMRVGGCLELAAGPRMLVRIKKPQPTLRDERGQAVPDTLITGELGGLDRAAYRTMFSLDDDTLEAGGNSILASNGELGQLLFSASAGLAELSRTLLGIRAEADGFTRPGGRSGGLHDLTSAATALKQARDSVDTLASAYNRLATDRKTTAARYEAALAEQSQAHAALAQHQRMLAALPRMAALRRLREKLQTLAHLPAAPPGWLEALPDLEQTERRHRSENELAGAELKRLSDAVVAIVVDDAALGMAGMLDGLATLGARHATAEIDLPLRRRELARIDGEVDGVLARLGRQGEAEPGRLCLSAIQSVAFDELLTTRSGIEAKLSTATDELSQALLAMTEARQARQAEPSGVCSEPAAALLVSALQAVRGSDHAVRRRLGERARDQHLETLTMQMARLAPWVGDAEALSGLRLPETADLASWRAEAERDAAQLSNQRDRIEQLEGELAARSDELDAAGKIQGLLSDGEAADVRTARDMAWAKHRRALDDTTADQFEAALRRDDTIGTARLGRERDLARLHQISQAVAVKQGELGRAGERLTELATTQARHARAVALAAASASPALAGFSPEHLQNWAGYRRETLACLQQLRQAERDLGEVATDEIRLRGRLGEALGKAGAAFDSGAEIHTLEHEAQGLIDREGRQRTLQRDVETCEREMRTRELAMQKAALADRRWATAWREACSACWLGAAGACLPVEAVRALLAAAAGLGPLLQRSSDLADRIRNMEEDQRAFGQEIDRLTAALGIDRTGRSAADLAVAVADRVRDAANAHTDMLRLGEALAAAHDKERAVRAAAQAHGNRVAEMMGALQADSLLALAGKLRDAQHKDELQLQAADAEGEILTLLRVETLDDAEATLDGADEPAIEIEQCRLAARLVDLEQQTRELFALDRDALTRIAAVGGDDAAARIEAQRRTKLIEIEAAAEHYLRLRLGILAAERGLRKYRDQHRSSMMDQASEAFRLISRGAYSGLRPQPGKDGEVLVAVGADGGSKLAADLSKGTRFQLYLALRAAGYREYARFRKPVPFIADDIMETFDDFRAEETLKVLGEMSRLGQVVYLTHHDHLRAIAQRVVPGVRVHELVP